MSLRLLWVMLKWNLRKAHSSSFVRMAQRKGKETFGKYSCQNWNIWPHLGMCLWLSVSEYIVVGAWLKFLSMPECVYRSVSCARESGHMCLTTCLYVFWFMFVWSYLPGRKCDCTAREYLYWCRRLSCLTEVLPLVLAYDFLYTHVCVRVSVCLKAWVFMCV